MTLSANPGGNPYAGYVYNPNAPVISNFENLVMKDVVGPFKGFYNAYVTQGTSKINNVYTTSIRNPIIFSVSSATNTKGTMFQNNTAFNAVHKAELYGFSTILSFPSGIFQLIGSPVQTASSEVSGAEFTILHPTTLFTPKGIGEILGSMATFGFIQGVFDVGSTPKISNVEVISGSDISKTGEATTGSVTVKGVTGDVILNAKPPDVSGTDIVPYSGSSATDVLGKDGFKITGVGKYISQRMGGITYTTFDVGRIFKQSYLAISQTEGEGLSSDAQSISITKGGVVTDLYKLDNGQVGYLVKGGIVTKESIVTSAQPISDVSDFYNNAMKSFPGQGSELTRYAGKPSAPGQPFRFVSGTADIFTARIAVEDSQLPAVSMMDIISRQATDVASARIVDIQYNEFTGEGEGYARSGQLPSGEKVTIAKGFADYKGVSGPIKFTSIGRFVEDIEPSGLSNLPDIFKATGSGYTFSQGVSGALTAGMRMSALTTIYPLTALVPGTGAAYFGTNFFGTYTGSLTPGGAGALAGVSGAYSVSSNAGGGTIELQKVIQEPAAATSGTVVEPPSTQTVVQPTKTQTVVQPTKTSSGYATTRSITRPLTLPLTLFDPLIMGGFRYSLTGISTLTNTSLMAGQKTSGSSRSVTHQAPLLTTNPYLTTLKSLNKLVSVTRQTTKQPTAQKNPGSELFPIVPPVPSLPISYTSLFDRLKPTERKPTPKFKFKIPSFKYVADYAHADLRLFGRKTRNGLSRPLVASGKRGRRR